MPPLLTCSGLALSTVLAAGFTAPDQDTRLADYFGFGELEIVRVDRGAGPMTVADIDGDGFQDLIIVNNHASRIEVHYQRPGASPDDQITTISRPNELPEHWRFRRELLSVSHRVLAVVPHDFDGDGRLDIIYAGLPVRSCSCVRQAMGSSRWAESTASRTLPRTATALPSPTSTATSDRSCWLFLPMRHSNSKFYPN